MKVLILTATLLLPQMSHSDTRITIYSGNHQGHLDQNQLQNINNINGFSMIKQTRNATFQKGVFSLSFDDVAEHIDPTTVTFDVPDNPDSVAVMDQNFQFDLVSTDKLLQKYLDENITVFHSQGNKHLETQGMLLSTEGGLTLRTHDNKVTTVKNWDQIDFPELPGGLLTKPTLVWLLNSDIKGQQKIALTYQTKGMTWWTDYNITLDDSQDNCRLNLSSWVTIVNKSGAPYDQAGLKLVAGDVNRSQPRNNRGMVRNNMAHVADSQFSEDSLFEYHMYHLPRKVDLPNNSTKQIQLLQNTNNINCESKLVYNGSQQSNIRYHNPITEPTHLHNNHTKVDAFLSFKNATDNHLGIPLPAGRVRVNILDKKDNSLEFIGEDSIDHTATNKTINLKLGNSFDVSGIRKQTDFKLYKNSLKEQFEVTIDNQKNQHQQVEIIEPLYRWSQWQITEHNEEYSQVNSSTIKFSIDVPAGEKRTVTYTVMYEWPNNK